MVFSYVMGETQYNRIVISVTGQSANHVQSSITRPRRLPVVRRKMAFQRKRHPDTMLTNKGVLRRNRSSLFTASVDPRSVTFTGSSACPCQLPAILPYTASANRILASHSHRAAGPLSTPRLLPAVSLPRSLAVHEWFGAAASILVPSPEALDPVCPRFLYGHNHLRELLTFFVHTVRRGRLPQGSVHTFSHIC